VIRLTTTMRRSTLKLSASLLMFWETVSAGAEQPERTPTNMKMPKIAARIRFITVCSYCMVLNMDGRFNAMSRAFSRLDEPPVVPNNSLQGASYSPKTRITGEEYLSLSFKTTGLYLPAVKGLS